jgi:hypothetical protein
VCLSIRMMGGVELEPGLDSDCRYRICSGGSKPYVPLDRFTALAESKLGRSRVLFGPAIAVTVYVFSANR